MEHELIGRNPAKGSKRRLPAVKPHRSWLDRADHISALLDAARELDRAGRASVGLRGPLIATLLFAGLRIGEAQALRWRDVDLLRGTIRVCQAETDAGVRIVHMLPILRRELGQYRSHIQAAPGQARVPYCRGTSARLLEHTRSHARPCRGERERRSRIQRAAAAANWPYAPLATSHLCLAVVRSRGATDVCDEPDRAHHPCADARHLRPGDEPSRRRAPTPEDAGCRRSATGRLRGSFLHCVLARHTNHASPRQDARDPSPRTIDRARHSSQVAIRGPSESSKITSRSPLSQSGSSRSADATRQRRQQAVSHRLSAADPPRLIHDAITYPAIHASS